MAPSVRISVLLAKHETGALLGLGGKQPTKSLLKAFLKNPTLYDPSPHVVCTLWINSQAFGDGSKHALLVIQILNSG